MCAYVCLFLSCQDEQSATIRSHVDISGDCESTSEDFEHWPPAVNTQSLS